MYKIKKFQSNFNSQSNTVDIHIFLDINLVAQVQHKPCMSREMVLKGKKAFESGNQGL